MAARPALGFESRLRNAPRMLHRPRSSSEPRRARDCHLNPRGQRAARLRLGRRPPRSKQGRSRTHHAPQASSGDNRGRRIVARRLAQDGRSVDVVASSIHEISWFGNRRCSCRVDGHRWSVQRFAVQRRGRRRTVSSMLHQCPCGVPVRCNGLLGGLSPISHFFGTDLQFFHLGLSQSKPNRQRCYAASEQNSSSFVLSKVLFEHVVRFLLGDR